MTSQQTLPEGEGMVRAKGWQMTMDQVGKEGKPEKWPSSNMTSNKWLPASHEVTNKVPKEGQQYCLGN